MKNRSKSRSIIALLSTALPVVGFGLVVLLGRWVNALPKGPGGVPIRIDEVGLPIIYWVLLAIWVAAVGLAVVGLCLRRLGCSQAAGTVFLVVLGLLGQWFVLVQPRCYSPSMMCLSNVKQLALAQQMYAKDWDGPLPRAGDWVAALEPYHGSNRQPLICPEDKRAKRQAWEGIGTSYTMNELCDGIDFAAFNVPADTVLLFEGTALYGRGEVAAFRHPMARKDRLNVGYVDGHAKMLDKSSFEQLQWKP